MTRLLPERIREAREAAGYTDEAFAEAIGVSRQSVGFYETGVATPRGDVFSRIVAVTKQPPHFFTTERRRGGERFRMPNWRSLKRMQRPSRLRISRRMEWAYDIVEYFSAYIDLPSVNLPEANFDPDQDGDEQIEAVADYLRSYWDLGLGPIADLTPILEYNGVIVIEEPVNCEDMDAVSRWQGGRPYILIDSDEKSFPRKLFNLAHELGHIVLHTGVEVNSKNIDRIERQANRFAGAFLMPRASFSKEVASTTIDYFLSMKGRWRVAVAAMVYRCKELGIINPYQVKYIWKQMNARRIRKSEPLDTAFPISKPSVLGAAVEMITSARRRSSSQIVEDMALNAQDVESLCGVPPGSLQQKIVPLRG